MRVVALSISLVSSGMTALFSMAAPAPVQLVTDSTYTIGSIAIQTKSVVGEAVEVQVDEPEVVQTPSVEKVETQKVFVTIKKGDTLTKLAKEHSTSFQRLFDANTNIKNPDFINPGDKIRIPYKDEELKPRELPKPKQVTPKPRHAITKKSSPVVSPVQQSRIYTQAPAVSGGSVWDQLAKCESGGNWSINTGNGYYGGIQFSLPTWQSVGGSGYPHQNSREEQIARGKILQARSGWGQWPACAAKLGLL